MGANVTERRLSGAVDIHSHILFGIDDGAVELNDSLNMAKLSASLGTVVMAATPHRYYGGRENTPDKIRSLVAIVQKQVEALPEKIDFQVVIGQEIPLSLNTAFEIQMGDVLTYNDAGKFVLVEPPFDRLPDWITEAVSKIRDMGITPVFAHPERNSVIQKDPSIMREIVKAGAMIQLTAMSLTHDNGNRAYEAAIWALREGLVSIVSSDCHSATWRPPLLELAFIEAIEQVGLEAATPLFTDNPRRVALSN